MNKKNQTAGINRREFIQTTAKVAASAMVFSLGTSKIFGALTLTPRKIPLKILRLIME